MTDILELAKRVEALDGADMQTFCDVRDAVWPYFDGCGQTRLAARQEFDRFLFNGAFLDAAMTLVPEGWQFCVTNSNGAWVRMSDNHPTIHGSNKHPALALVAAALRAKEATNEQ